MKHIGHFTNKEIEVPKRTKNKTLKQMSSFFRGKVVFLHLTLSRNNLLFRVSSILTPHLQCETIKMIYLKKLKGSYAPLFERRIVLFIGFVNIREINCAIQWNFL